MSTGMYGEVDTSDRRLRARARRFAAVRRDLALYHLAQVVQRRTDQRFDGTMGIDTMGAAEAFIEPSDLTVVAGDPAEGHVYGTEPVLLTRWWLDALPDDLSEFTLVDLGSGEGRILFVAATYGFRRVVGVEFARELHEKTEANIARAAIPANTEIVSVLGDAGAYEYPDTPLVVHFGNPFGEAVTRRVIERLTAAYERRPRPIIAVYQQSRVESDRTRTRNVDLLAAVPFLTHRRLRATTLGQRALLRQFRVDLFESPEVPRAAP